MAAQDQINVQLNLITSGATKALDGLKSSTNNVLKSMNVDIGKVSGSVGGVAKSFFSVKNAAVAAAGAVLTFFASKEVLSKAIAQENAINSVAVALGRTGQFSRAALRDLEAYATQLSLNSTYADEEILKQVSLAMAFGATADQAKLITRASIELAAATGKSLDEATRQVSKTLGGFAGELGEVNPRIKALSAEQLKAGAAAQVLLQQYGGTAVGAIRNFGGALAQSKNTFGDLLEQVGMLITKNPVVVAAINSATDTFARLALYLEQNRSAIISFVNDGIVSLLNAAPKIAIGLKFLVDTITVLTKSLALATAGFNTLISALLNIAPVKLLFDGLVDVIGKVASGFLRLFEVIVDIPFVNETLKTMGINADELSMSLNSAAASAFDLSESVNVDKISEGIDKMNDFAFSIVEGATEVREGLNTAIDEGVKKAQNLAKAVKSLGAKGQVELNVKNNEESVKASIDNYGQALELAFGGVKGGKIGGALIQGIATGLKNGKEGARALMSSLASTAADAFLPGVGQIVGPLIDVLSQGPEAVRQMVKDFAGAIPDLIENIITALPVLIEEFSNQLPIIVERLAERMDEIIIALVKAMPRVGIALTLQAPKVMLALAKEAPKFVGAMIKAIGDAIKEFLGLGKGGVLDKATGGLFSSGGKSGGGLLGAGPTKSAGVNTALNIITLGGSGVVTKAYEGVKKFFGFSQGGEVPMGYPNDTLPAKLSSEELVIDRSTNRKLKEFLEDGGDGMSAALLIQIRDLLLQPMEVTTSMNINQREFATVLLQMARTNQRTS